MNEEIRADRLSFKRAYLVGIQFQKTTAEEVEDHLEELRSLVATLGVEVVGSETVRLQRPSPQFLIGKGRAEDLRGKLEALDVDLLIFDDDLSPPQQHLWESKTKIAVIDRRKVIIDIFAQRAQTREARLQIELASLVYMLPRLKRAWTHLERQRGGGGFIGGAGEAQIEIDRRLVRDRIAKVKRELVSVRKHRDTTRKRRESEDIPTAALVGYTNSGKSTLLNRLTEAGVLTEDKLFATLDPTTRRITLPNNQGMLLTDTVGFIRKLPHTLVDAFRSTLEEAVKSDILLHVVDVSHPQAEEQLDVTRKVLEELGAKDRKAVLVLNKTDLLGGGGESAEEQLRAAAARLDGWCEYVIPVSAHRGDGIGQLLDALAAMVAPGLADIHVRIPSSRYDVVSELFREGEVLEQRYDDSEVLMHVLLPVRSVARVEQYATAPW